MKNVLWLASWYPNRMDNFDGDFIQRHAKAVANYCHVHVICVIKDISITAKEPVIEEKRTGNLTEQVIYYNSVKTGIEKLDKYLSQKKYNRLYREAIKKYIAENDKPQLVHVHVAMKAGLPALWMQRQWNIPFIVSEHWTGYLPEADIQVKDLPFTYRKWLQRIFTKTSAITVVSEYLGNAIRRQFDVADYTVIPNVVDTDIFFPADKQPAETTRFVHVSNISWQKNVEDILRSLVILKNKTTSFEMNIYGALKTAHRKMIDDLGLAAHVFLRGEVPQHELAKAMQQADALVLYSRFETFGCVLIEANACGVPAIVSDIEVFYELIKDGNNGIFVKGNDPAALAEAFSVFTGKKSTFNKDNIAQTAAAKYNFKKVAQRFIDLYDKTSAVKG